MGSYFSYQIALKGFEDQPRTVIAATPGKAKYQVWQEVGEHFNSFQHFLENIAWCRKICSFPMADFRKTCISRGIPFAEIGMKVRAAGRDGVIIGVNTSANLDVLFDDGTTGNCHPHWNITYFGENGEIIQTF